MRLESNIAAGLLGVIGLAGLGNAHLHRHVGAR